MIKWNTCIQTLSLSPIEFELWDLPLDCDVSTGLQAPSNRSVLKVGDAGSFKLLLGSKTKTDG